MDSEEFALIKQIHRMLLKRINRIVRTQGSIPKMKRKHRIKSKPRIDNKHRIKSKPSINRKHRIKRKPRIKRKNLSRVDGKNVIIQETILNDKDVLAEEPYKRKSKEPRLKQKQQWISRSMFNSFRMRFT